MNATEQASSPAPRFVPGFRKILAVPVTIPFDLLRQTAGVPWELTRRLDSIGTNRGASQTAASALPAAFWMVPETINQWVTLADPIEVAQVGGKTPGEADVQAEVSIPIRTAGTLHGLVIYFDGTPASGQSAVRQPSGLQPAGHWHTCCWVRPQPLEVAVGDCLRLTYSSRPPSMADRVRLNLISRLSGLEGGLAQTQPTS